MRNGHEKENVKARIKRKGGWFMMGLKWQLQTLYTGPTDQR